MAPLIEIVSDGKNATVYATTMQAVARNFRGKVGKINLEAIRKISEEAEKNFAASILRPETSVTAGGTTYRATSTPARGEGGRLIGRKGASRVSGRFTFGPGKTFTGSLLKNQRNVTGFGYPIVARADRITKKVWRGLEFGWPSMRMPTKGIWRDSSGQRVTSRSPGGDAFFPAGPSERRVAGIEAKLFITNAFSTVVNNFVEPAYRQAAELAAKEASGAALKK